MCTIWLADWQCSCQVKQQKVLPTFLVQQLKWCEIAYMYICVYVRVCMCCCCWWQYVMTNGDFYWLFMTYSHARSRTHPNAHPALAITITHRHNAHTHSGRQAEGHARRQLDFKLWRARPTAAGSQSLTPTHSIALLVPNCACLALAGALHKYTHIHTYAHAYAAPPPLSVFRLGTVVLILPYARCFARTAVGKARQPALPDCWNVLHVVQLTAKTEHLYLCACMPVYACVCACLRLY